MAIVFSYPTQASPTLSWTPSKPPRFPIGHKRDFHRQARGETAGGAVLVQDPSTPAREMFELVFDHLPEADRDQVALFFDTVRKTAAPFDYTDPGGGITRVRWWSAFDFKQAAAGRHSGTIQLLKEPGA